jgi:hypothetical protein
LELGARFSEYRNDPDNEFLILTMFFQPFFKLFTKQMKDPEMKWNWDAVLQIMVCLCTKKPIEVKDPEWLSRIVSDKLQTKIAF